MNNNNNGGGSQGGYSVDFGAGQQQGGYSVGYGAGQQQGGYSVDYGAGQQGGYSVGYGTGQQQGGYSVDYGGGGNMAPRYGSNVPMTVTPAAPEMSGGRKVLTFVGRSAALTFKYFAAKALIGVIMGLLAWVVFSLLKIPYAGIFGIILGVMLRREQDEKRRKLGSDFLICGCLPTLGLGVIIGGILLFSKNQQNQTVGKKCLAASFISLMLGLFLLNGGFRA